jgi:DNA polymerase-3 subunit delta'
VRFAALKGQDHATAVLRRAVASRRVPHAYLFEGPEGVGKRAAAYGLAMALCCAVEPGEGCGACEPCRRIGAGLHPDVPLFAPEGTQILLDQAQAIVALAQTRPHEAAARVIIIDDADRLNLNAANGLLKTLEEPAAGTHIVLVTGAPDRILPTIRSRVQRIRFRPLPAEALVALLVAAHGVDERRAAVAAALAEGSVARALRAASAGDDALWGAVASLREAAGARQVGRIFDAAVAVAADKEDKQALPPMLALLARLYRDGLVTAAGAPELALFREPAAELAPLGTARLGKALAALVEADGALAANMNAVVAVERLLLELRRRGGGERAAR